MGASDSPDRQRSGDGRHRHGSRHSPDRNHSPDRHHERSRHERDRSRERSRHGDGRGSDRHYDNDRRDRSAHHHHHRREERQHEDSRSRPGHHSRREEHRGEYSRDHWQQGRQQDGPSSKGAREDRDDRQRERQQQQQPEQQRGRPGGGRPAAGDDDGGSKQRWGKPEEWAEEEAAAAAPAVPKEGPNMGLSGKLAAETNKTVDGTGQLKYQPPAEARVCKKPPWRLYVFKGEQEAAPPITLTQTPFYLFGKDRKLADIPTDHPSCSRQHAVLCFREVEVDAPDGIATLRVVKPYLLDLESVNGTTINKEKLEPARYYELLHSDVIRFGLSSREYVIMNEATV